MDSCLIAVVDDDQLVRSATTSLLRSFGYRCCGFSSAEDFLRDSDRAYDCVVSDIQMPGMSGVQLAHLLHERPAAPPVILITAYPEAPAAHAQRSGVVANLLEKPLDGDSLLAAIEAALGGTDARGTDFGGDA